MNEQQALGWLGRKIGWGFRPGQLDEWTALGVDAVIDTLVDADASGVPARRDPFDGLIPDDPTEEVQNLGEGVTSWLRAAVDSPRHLETFMEFFWSDYFAVSARSVRPTWLMYDHVNLLGRHGLGNFGDLLHDVTIDAAMLGFLDGVVNAVGRPNENYGRELLELYSVGIGNFSEADVQAASVALTGWSYRRRDPIPRFVARRHDDTPQTLLGVEGVHDVDTVIDAVVTHPATATRVVTKLAAAILGPGHQTDLSGVISAFASGLEIRPAVRSLLELAVDGAAAPSIVEPVPFFVTATRFTQGRPVRGELRTYFRGSAQVPLLPPNVGGFPDPDSYLSTSATIARFNLASAMATTADRAAVDASRDLDGLARSLGLVDGFRPTTRDAISALPAGADRITAALASPDLLVV